MQEKNPNKSMQRLYYRFLWKWDELHLYSLLALRGLGRDFQKAHVEFRVDDF